MYTSFIIT